MSASKEPLFNIRRAEEKHASKIKHLIRQSGINPTALDWRRFFIAEDHQGYFIGCGQVKSHADGSMELASLAVQPSWRRKGVASALINRLLDEYPGELYLMCQSSLGALYEKFDFFAIQEEAMPKYFRRISKLAGVLENLRRQGESLLIMHKPADSKMS